jgi:hypothetical protein
MKKHLIPALSAQKINEFEAFRLSGENRLENSLAMQLGRLD